MGPSPGGHAESARRNAVLWVTAATFFLVLIPFEFIPEVPVDIDAKPFFVPLVLCALLPARQTALTIGLGVALGEGVRDLMEGYELDDPIGFFGYIAGFWAASWVFALAPRQPVVLVLGSVICGGVQAAIEATSFLLFGAGAIGVAVESAVGNTISHGLLLGGLPLLAVVPILRGRIEPLLGYEPRGRLTAPLPSTGGIPDRSGEAIAATAGFSFAWPGRDEGVTDLTITVRRGEIVHFVGGGALAGALGLAGLAPAVTGGRSTGAVVAARRPGFLSARPGDQVTQMTPREQVAAVALAASGGTTDPRVALAAASARLVSHGLSEDQQTAFVWTLPDPVLAKVALAAQAERQPDLLVVETGPTEDALASDLEALLAVQRGRGAVVVVGDDLPDRVIADRTLSVAGAPKDAIDGGGGGDGDPGTAPATAAASPGRAVRIPTLMTGRSTWWHRRDPRAKWLVLFLTLALIYVAPDWRWMAGMTAGALLLAATARPPLGWLAIALIVQVPNVLALVVLPWLSGEDLAFGLRLALGWIGALIISISLLSTMSIPAIVRGLDGLGLPRAFSAALGNVFTLIYLTAADLVRSGTFAAFPRGARFRTLFRLPIDVMEAVARRAGLLALALAATGDGAGRAPYLLHPLGRQDRVIIALATAILGAAALARLGFR